MRALCIALASALLSACSLLGLDDYEEYACDPGTRCEHLNEDIGDQCMQYACSESGRGCELQPYDGDYDGHPSRELCGNEEGIAELDCDDADKLRWPGLVERCDGRDNDCNGFIDEETTPREPVDELTLDEGIEQVSMAASSDDAPLLAITRFDGTTFTTASVRVLDADLAEPRPFAFNGPEQGENLCTVLEGTSASCRIAQLALGASGNTLLGVGVHRGGGCTDGQMRAGAGSLNDATLILGAPDEGNVARGIDVDSMKDNCTYNGACVGAQDPAIAVLGSAGSHSEQALAAWLAPSADACEEACGCPDAFQVMAIGLFAGGAATEAYVDGSDEGHATPVGGGDATGAPAIIAFETSERDSGYFIAYPAGDRVALRFVPRFGERTLALNDLPEAQLEADGARQVAWPERLLTSDDPKTPQGLALAFVDEGGGALRFATLELDAENASLSAGEPITLATGGTIAGRPSLVYAPDGFIDDAASGPHGGWLLLWIEEDGSERVLRGQRIAEAKLRLLGEPIELARGAIDHPFTFLKHVAGERSVMRYGFVDDDTLRVTRITCDMDN